MKILDLNDMLEAAEETDLPHFKEFKKQAEALGTHLAAVLAKHLEIKATKATYEGGFGGLCASFYPAKKGQDCPDVINEGDEGGDWP